LLLAACLLPLSAHAAATVKGIEIRHVGPQAVSDELIRANIRTKVGDEYNPTRINDDVSNLYRTGYFSNIRVLEDKKGDDYQLTYVVVAKQTLTEIRVEGNKKFGNKKLLKKVTSKVGDPLDERKLFTDAQAMKKLYEASGYHRTTVEYKTVVNENTGRGSVTFEVTESPKVKIRDVVFEGAQAFSQGKLRRTIKTRRHWMFSWLTSSGKLKDEQFEEDKNKLAEFYRDEGYIDFEIRDIKFEYPTEKRMVIRFEVYEGKQYKVGSVDFKGNELFTADQISYKWAGKKKGYMQMKPGGTFSPKALGEDIEAIQDFYASRGYIGKGSSDRIRVNAIRTPNVEKGTMDVVYQVEEGEPSYVEKIEIKGNQKTKDKVIRRELAVTPGERFDMVRVKLSKERLEGLQYFNKVETEVEPTDVVNQKNLVISVEEGTPGNFYMGAGFSSIDSLFGYVGVTQGNFDLFNPPYFTGGGQKLRVQAQIGTRRKDYLISFIEPWFLDRKLIFETDLYHRELSYLSDLFDEQRTGIKLGITRPLFNDYVRLGLNYTIEEVGLINVSDDASPTIKEEEGHRLVSKFGTTLSYDTRGGGMLPNRGQRTELSAELAGGPFGGETDFYRLNLRHSRYIRGFFEGHVVELLAETGIIEEYGASTRVPLFDRFFLGGANSLRGYKYRRVGPRDNYGEPIGGSTYWWGTAEYSIPIIERLRFALFYDVGMVYPQAYQYDFATYNDNWGFGIRLNIPRMGPLKLDYGIPINHGPDNKGSGRFQFGVGFSRDF
jgi:outer membrane protein insertion porin family